MRSKFTLDSIVQSFFVSKFLPGLLVGLFAYHMTAERGGDNVTFFASMVVFWAATGVGHGLAQLATQQRAE